MRWSVVGIAAASPEEQGGRIEESACHRWQLDPKTSQVVQNMGLEND